MTKCGRFGAKDFDYSPSRIRQCVVESLQRLQTHYLDVVYLHDVEFVATPVLPRLEGNHVTALNDEAGAYGLAKGDEAKVRGQGDRIVLEALAELRKLKQEGIIKNIGITGTDRASSQRIEVLTRSYKGYPVPTLLRLAILVNSTPPFEPLDVVLSYSHLTLQNSTFNEFMPHFYERAKVKQLVAAGPLSMGLLAPKPPSWHPAPEALRSAVAEAVENVPDLPTLAQGYTARQTGTEMPLVGGFCNMKEVHECVRVWREVHEKRDELRIQQEKDVIAVFGRSQYLDWSWKSP